MRAVVVLLLTVGQTLLATRVAEASGLEPCGVGARARSMGYAMVAVADDWSAAYSNPAGLVQVKNREFACGYELFAGGMSSTESLRNLKLSQGANPARGDFVVPEPLFDEPMSFNEKSMGATIHAGELGYAASWGKFAFGAALYGSGSGSAWEDTAAAGTDTISAEFSFANVSITMPLAFAYETSPNLSFGLSLGIRYGVLDVENNKYRVGATSPYIMEGGQNTEGVDVGVDIGALWKPSAAFSVGGVIRLPYTFEKSGKATVNNTLVPLNVSSDMTVEESYPLRITTGCAWRPDDRNLLAFAMTWLNWSDYEQSVDYKNEIPGVFDDWSGNPANWHDTWVVNLGYERELNERWKFRCGLTFDEAPEPADAKTLIGGKVVDCWILAVGAGRTWQKSGLDFGYTYTYGPEVSGYVPGAGYSMRTHEFYIGYKSRF